MYPRGQISILDLPLVSTSNMIIIFNQEDGAKLFRTIIAWVCCLLLAWSHMKRISYFPLSFSVSDIVISILECDGHLETCAGYTQFKCIVLHRHTHDQSSVVGNVYRTHLPRYFDLCWNPHELTF